MAAHYDDPAFSYAAYWLGRDYEHASEILALKKLLPNKKFPVSGDIGGGFGRLVPFLVEHSRKVFLIEPSKKQRSQAQKYLSDFRNLEVLPGNTNSLPLPDASLDLAIMVRVMHHLPDPESALVELHRVLKPGGLLVLEFANSLNFKSRLQSFISGQPILPLPIERRSPANIRRHTISFVNHHPHTVLKTLRFCHFDPLRLLSVSNFRYPFLKRYLPMRFHIFLESISQSPLSKIFFGPSIFILARRVDNNPIP